MVGFPPWFEETGAIMGVLAYAHGASINDGESWIKRRTGGAISLWAQMVPAKAKTLNRHNYLLADKAHFHD